MCGRYALALSNEEIYDALQEQLPRMFDHGRPRWERPQDYRPNNYNVAPRQRMPVIRRDPEHREQAMIETMQWGLIPHWNKHPPTTPLSTINARSEALLEPSGGGMWKAMKGYKRCIIPAQGYYEWQKKASTKVPHFTRRPLSTKDSNTSADAEVAAGSERPLMFLAGLWDTVKYVSPVESHFQPSTDPEDKREPYPTGNPVPLSTFTILTTTPPKDFLWLHDRMPCLLTSWEDIERWLDLGEAKGWVEGKGGTGDLLKGMSGLESYPVPPERSDGIKSFFQKQAASPAKGSQTKLAAQTPSKPAKRETSSPTKEEKPSASSTSRGKGSHPEHPTKKELKEEAEGLDTRISPGHKTKGIGDDSNAPNPHVGSGTVKEEKPTSRRAPSEASPSKRKRAQDAVLEDEPAPAETSQRKGGHQTKVVRRNLSDDKGKAQPSIEAFFKTPEETKTKTEAEASATRTRSGGRRGKK
ncbi:hypothetical protein EHS25_009932 [Saitozyma podzolica]|uniref:DUF159-domain-containing protein n=1 Tax=Saitozyma podzolica TaxID=1890683 RepID=A0A427YI54_9TREE|nr:hypothetical protein EHS25_009932 [Saitozyma podzolica]